MSTAFDDAIQQSKDQASRQLFQDKVNSFDFFFDFTSLGRSMIYVSICFLVTALCSAGWYFCCFGFDATVVANGPRRNGNNKNNTKSNSSSDDDDDNDGQAKRKNQQQQQQNLGLSIIGRLRLQNESHGSNNNNKEKSFLQTVVTKLTSSVTIFILSLVVVWPAWIAFSLFIMRFMFENNNKNTNNNNSTSSSFSSSMQAAKSTLSFTLAPTFVFLLQHTLFGVCAVIYIIQENLSTGILTHLAQLILSLWLLENPLSSSLQLRQNNNSKTVYPHPLCASFQFLSLLASFSMLLVFVLMFVQLEMRKALKEDYPQLVELVEKSVPEWMFPKEKVDKNSYIKSLIRGQKGNSNKEEKEKKKR